MAVLHPSEGNERCRSLGNGTHVGGSRGRHDRKQVLTFNVSVQLWERPSSNTEVSKVDFSISPLFNLSKKDLKQMNLWFPGLKSSWNMESRSTHSVAPRGVPRVTPNQVRLVMTINHHPAVFFQPLARAFTVFLQHSPPLRRGSVTSSASQSISFISSITCKVCKGGNYRFSPMHGKDPHNKPSANILG